MTWRVFIQTDYSQMADELVIVEEGAQRSDRVVAKPLEFEKTDPRLSAEPTLRLPEGEINDLLQAFADAAWERGIRPRQIEDQRNQVAAMTEHLSDLRRVSFKLLKIDP